MNRITLALILFFLFDCPQLSSQDLHFTDYRFSPLQFNPAHTGAFYGSYRLSGTYRSQFNSFIENGYETALLNFDSPLDFGFTENDWVGWGFNIYRDLAGDLGFLSNAISGSAAYHLSLNEDYKDVITVGVQYGQVGRKFNDAMAGTIRLDDELTGAVTSSTDRSLIESFEDSYADLNVGLLYRKKLNEVSSMELGISMHHLLGSESDMTNGNQTFRRANIHGGLLYQINSQFILEPRFYLSASKDFTDIALQCNGNYHLSQRDGLILHFGVGHRVQDAVEFLIGATYRKWKVGFAYDLTVSTASAYNNTNGAFEIGVQRIFNIYKRPEPDPTVFCPRF